MQRPPGVKSDVPFFKLQRTLYDLKQAPREWHASLRSHLVDTMGLTMIKSSECLFLNRTASGRLCIAALHVDNVIIIGHPELVAEIKRGVLTKFKCTDLGELRYCLGIEIKQNLSERSIGLSQEKFATDLLKMYAFEHSRPASTPGDKRLTKAMYSNTEVERRALCEEFEANLPYRPVVCSLLWLCNTRPDIVYQVNQLARFLDDPGREHYTALKRVLKYLNGTQSCGLTLTSSRTSTTGSAAGLSIRGYGDSDYAGDLD